MRADVDGRRESRAAAVRNVSSTTRADNSQSSRGTAVFPQPRLPGRRGLERVWEEMFDPARPVGREFSLRWFPTLLPLLAGIHHPPPPGVEMTIFGFWWPLLPLPTLP